MSELRGVRCLLRTVIVALLFSFIVRTRGEDSHACADASKLLPFVAKQIKQGMRLIVFQGTAVPQVCGPGDGDLGSGFGG